MSIVNKALPANLTISTVVASTLAVIEQDGKYVATKGKGGACTLTEVVNVLAGDRSIKVSQKHTTNADKVINYFKTSGESQIAFVNTCRMTAQKGKVNGMTIPVIVALAETYRKLTKDDVYTISPLTTPAAFNTPKQTTQSLPKPAATTNLDYNVVVDEIESTFRKKKKTQEEIDAEQVAARLAEEERQRIEMERAPKAVLTPAAEDGRGNYIGELGDRLRLFMKVLRMDAGQRGWDGCIELGDRNSNKALIRSELDSFKKQKIKVGTCFSFNATVIQQTEENDFRMTTVRDVEILEVK